MSTIKSRAAAAGGSGGGGTTGSSTGKKSRKLEVLKRERTLLDDILTITFLALIGLVIYKVRSDYEWIIFLIVSLVVVTLFIFTAKFLADKVGYVLSEYVLNTSWTTPADRRPLRKKQTQKKFRDQSWQVGRSVSSCRPMAVVWWREGIPRQKKRARLVGPRWVTGSLAYGREREVVVHRASNRQLTARHHQHASTTVLSAASRGA
jgi:hypothetical protein